MEGSGVSSQSQGVFGVSTGTAGGLGISVVVVQGVDGSSGFGGTTTGGSYFFDVMGWGGGTGGSYFFDVTGSGEGFLEVTAAGGGMYFDVWEYTGGLYGFVVGLTGVVVVVQSSGPLPPPP